MEHRARRSDPGTVLYPFGYGLTLNKYTVYGPEIIKIGDGLAEISVRVENASEENIDVPVAVYTDKGDSALHSSSFALAAVRRVRLGANEIKDVRFNISSEWYKEVTESGEFVMPKGKIRFSAK